MGGCEQSLPLTPYQTGHCPGCQVVQVIRQEFFALSDRHAVQVRAVPEDAVGIHGGEGAPSDEGDFRSRGFQPPGQILGAA